MKLQRAVIGQQAQTEIFYNVTLDNPPVYRVLDFNGKLVLKGAGNQDITNTKRWTAQILIPANAPIGRPDQQYSIEWTGKSGTKEIVQTDSFSVVSNLAFEQESVEERVLMAGGRFNDKLLIRDSSPVSNMSLAIYTPTSDDPIYESGVISSVPSSFDGETQTFYHASPGNLEEMIAPTNNYRPYLIEWTWNQNGETQTEIHFLYAVNRPVIALMHNLRKHIDKARAEQRNPALQYRDADLLAYIDQGMQYLNAANPTFTRFTVSSLPPEFHIGALNCAAYCALTAQYLAEGQSAFEFSGQTVTLSIDRSQFIDTEINRLQNYMETQLPRTKKLWIMSSGGASNGYIQSGALGINISPSLNYNAGQFGFAPQLWARGIMF